MNYQKQETPYDLLGVVKTMAGIDQKPQDLTSEFYASRALAEATGRNPQGVLVPHSALASGHMTRDLTVGTATAGGNLVATELLSSRFVEMLRNRSAVMTAGPTVLSGLVGNVAIPRQTGAATAYWVAESGAPTESQQAFDQVPMSPKTVGAYTDMSRKLLLQSTPQISDLVRSDLLATIGIAVDHAVLNGTGMTNQPTGLLNASGLSDTDLGGSDPTLADVVELETIVASANGDQGNLSYICSPTMASKLKRTLTFSGPGGVPLVKGRIGGGMELNGHPLIVSNQAPTGTLIFGNWLDLVLGLWSAVDLLVDPYTFGASGGVRIVAMQDCDVAVRHIESFAVFSNASTS